VFFTNGNWQFGSGNLIRLTPPQLFLDLILRISLQFLIFVIPLIAAALIARWITIRMAKKNKANSAKRSEPARRETETKTEA
jgi:hypothetical protein